MKIEVGSGYNPDLNYDIHIDINPKCPHLEFVSSADNLYMIGANTVDELRACDILEHFSYRDTINVLAEWFRVLKPSGTIYIQCPNAKLIAQRWLANDLPIIDGMPIDFSASYWIMGGQEDGTFAKSGDNFRWNAHYTLFSEESLKWYLEKVGFNDINIQLDGGTNLMCWARK